MFLSVLEMMAWAVLSSLAGGSLAALALPSGRRHLAGFLDGRSRAWRRGRLRLAAALLDLGCNLMLCGEERKARRLEKKLSGRRARSSGLKAAAIRAGAVRRDEAALEILVGRRAQEGNPGRTLELSLAVHHPPPEEEPRRSALAAGESEEPCTLAWRVLNRPSEGRRGSSVSVEVPLAGAGLALLPRPAAQCGGARRAVLRRRHL